MGYIEPNHVVDCDHAEQEPTDVTQSVPRLLSACAAGVQNSEFRQLVQGMRRHGSKDPIDLSGYL